MVTYVNHKYHGYHLKGADEYEFRKIYRIY